MASFASRSVEGRTAVVTGSASGIGRATARLLAVEGAHVFAVLDLDGDAVDAVVAGITGDGGAATGWAVDVSDDEAVRQTITEVRDRLGAVDILVNNAGVSRPVAFDAPDEAFWAAWTASFEVNLVAQVRLIRLCLTDLTRNGDGRVVNVASTEGLGATAYGSPYTASKHGVIGLTRSLAVELGRRGLTVNAVCPGPIRTGMTAPIPDEAKDKFARRRVPLRRYGQPEELANAILNLVLPSSSYINGAVMVVDGGMLAQNT